MTGPIILEIEPIGADRFRASVGGREIVASSRVPLCDSARALLAGGHNAGDVIEMHDATGNLLLRAPIGVAAGLTVAETGHGPRLRPWIPFSRERGSPGVAPRDPCARGWPPPRPTHRCQDRPRGDCGEDDDDRLARRPAAPPCRGTRGRRPDRRADRPARSPRLRVELDAIAAYVNRIDAKLARRRNEEPST